ncbi:hypothetical protein A3H40_01735 [Candidatus Daviesbacteria bacterium RIFCSPLOWO2_02_FULL_38_15]|nr:MAG: hypothetical protein A3H40_01735 [Candidatus Daviesbacteria bacterium RIFCSPLOWO2_02_FULL_38_15]
MRPDIEPAIEHWEKIGWEYYARWQQAAFLLNPFLGPTVAPVDGDLAVFIGCAPVQIDAWFSVHPNQSKEEQCKHSYCTSSSRSIKKAFIFCSFTPLTHLN